MKYLMALDAGSGSCRSIIFSIDGKEIGSGSREWLHPTQPEYPGSQIFDTTKNWKLICESIGEALRNAEIESDKIAAVSATSMRFGSVLYDREGNELWAAPNTDSRSSEQVDAAQKKGIFEKFYGVTGDGFALCDLMRWLWVKENLPETWQEVRHFTLISDWILYKLSGQFASNPSIAACSGLFDISKRTWSEETAQLFSIPLEICPVVHESGTVIGEVTAEASKETGLAAGTPVVMGGGDTMAGLIGTGHVEKGGSAVFGGTHWQQTFLSDKPVIDPLCRMRVSPHMVTKLWMLETNAVFIGLTMRWFRDAFCDGEKIVARNMGVDAYYLMEKIAEQAPVGSNGLLALFANLFNTKSWVHGPSAFMEFDITSPQNFGKKEFIRRIEEDAAFQTLGNFRNIWDAAGSNGPDSKEVVFAGGASKGFLWPQILADVMGVKIRVPVVKEATAMGTAICAGVGIGLYDTLASAAKELVVWEKVFDPDPENHKIYLEIYERWHLIYQRALEMVEEGAVKPMWRVAGT